MTRAQARGLLGPGPVAAHIDHSLAFALLVPVPPHEAVDLGSGGGLPGLTLASLWSESRWVLLDAGARSTAFLREAVDALDLTNRVEVLCQRAEDAGRESRRRSQFDLAVARSFGSPAVTAECAAPLLRIGASLVVAEPPGGAPDRWPPVPLRELGLVPDQRQTTPIALQRLRQVSSCPSRYPRRPGIPAKRPLF